jgi:hypothetical protein
VPAPPPLVAPSPAPPQPAPPPPPAAPAGPWQFAVLSDLHLPNHLTETVERTVDALITLRVRLVIVTGDHTNGGETDFGHRHADEWWAAVTGALRPLRDAGIAVLPVAGNHDTYREWQTAGYAAAFADLDDWARPFTVNRPPPTTADARAWPPFSYSVDVGGVHLALAHVVAGHLEPEVAAWLEADLAAAAGAGHRMVFGHVPLASVIRGPRKRTIERFGGLLERGKVDHYVAGHEHLVWDEDVDLPGGGSLRQVLVGCASGFYNYQPGPAARRRARCKSVSLPGMREPMACRMPRTGGRFVISRGRKDRRIQHHDNGFVVFTVDGDRIDVEPMTIDDAGRLTPFYLP